MTKKDELLSILEHHCCGKANAKSGAVLRKMVRLSRSRFQKCINQLRKEEKPICSFIGGYFYAENAAELSESIDFLERFVVSTLAAIAGMKRGMRYFGRKP